MGSTLLKERRKTFNLVKSAKNNKLRKFGKFSTTPSFKNYLNRRNCYIRTPRVVSNRKRRVRVIGLKENRTKGFNHRYSHSNDDSDENSKKALFLYVLFGTVMSVIWNI